MRFVQIHVKPAAEGLEAEVTVSSSLLDDVVQRDVARWAGDDVYIELELPPLQPDPKGRVRYRLGEITVRRGGEDASGQDAPVLDEHAVRTRDVGREDYQ